MTSPDSALIQAAGQLLRALAPLQVRLYQIGSSGTWEVDDGPDADRAYTALTAGMPSLDALAAHVVRRQLTAARSLLLCATERGLQVRPSALDHARGDIDWAAVDAAVDAARRAHLQWVRSKQQTPAQIWSQVVLFAETLSTRPTRDQAISVPVVTRSDGVIHAVVVPEVVIGLFGDLAHTRLGRDLHRRIATDALTAFARVLCESTDAARAAGKTATEDALQHPGDANHTTPTSGTMRRSAFSSIGTLLVDPSNRIRLMDTSGHELARL